MESHADDTRQGIFDSDLTPPELLERVIVLKQLRSMQHIELIDEKRVDWYFFKHCDVLKMKAIVTFAEDWARCMQLLLSEGYTVRECWAQSANMVHRDTVSRAMAHCALNILSGVSVLGDELREAYEEYWKKIGLQLEQEQIEQLEDHLY